MQKALDQLYYAQLVASAEDDYILHYQHPTRFPSDP